MIRYLEAFPNEKFSAGFDVCVKFRVPAAGEAYRMLRGKAACSFIESSISFA